MLAFLPSSSPNYTPQHLPAIPSPLSPRSANIYGRHPYQMSHPTANAPLETRNENSTAAKPQKSSNATNERKVPFCSRNPKSAPLPKAKDLGDRRRNFFLRKVSEKRDEARFEARGEDMMRREFLLRQRAWEEDRAKEASSQDLIPVEVEEEEGAWEEEGMEEEFWREEEGEIEALLEMLPAEGGQREERMDEDEDEDDANLWSDGADYDELFEQVLSEQEREQQHRQYAGNMTGQDIGEQYQHDGQGLGEEMDMS